MLARELNDDDLKECLGRYPSLTSLIEERFLQIREYKYVKRVQEFASTSTLTSSSIYRELRSSAVVVGMSRGYQGSFSYFNVPKSHYCSRKLTISPPDAVWERVPPFQDGLPATPNNATKKEEAKKMALFCREYGRGLNQQRVRDKNRHRPGT